MKLLKEMFGAIVGWDSLHVEIGKTKDRRGLGRVRLPARVQVIPLSTLMAPKAISSQVRDLSQEGIGLLMPGKLLTGDHLMVRLEAKPELIWVYCDITRAEKVSANLYIVGATFTRLAEPQGAAERLAGLGSRK